MRSSRSPISNLVHPTAARLSSWWPPSGTTGALFAAVRSPADRSLWRSRGAPGSVRRHRRAGGVRALLVPGGVCRRLRPPPGARKPSSTRFAGLVMLADWLGSDRASFPSRTIQVIACRSPAPGAGGGEAIGLDVRPARTTLGERLPGFDRVSGFPPYEVQRRTMALGRPPRAASQSSSPRRAPARPRRRSGASSSSSRRASSTGWSSRCRRARPRPSSTRASRGYEAGVPGRGGRPAWCSRSRAISRSTT